MTLRWMSSGSCLFAQYYGVSSTTFYDLVNAACNAIAETFSIVFNMSERSLKQRAKDFGKRQWKHMRFFTGTVGCLDSILLKIECLSMAKVGMARGCWCHKVFLQVCLCCLVVTCMLHTHMVVSLKFPDLYFHLSPRHKYMTLCFLNVCTYVQAICDARPQFVFVSTDMPGATQDSRAFSFSALWAGLQIGLLTSGYYISGDAAYRGT